MENPATTLNCPNIRCQAANPQSHKFCQNCRTPLVRRYLWALGSGLKADQVGEAIADRYVLVGSSIVLDTQPAIPPELPQQIPPDILPYLRLSPYRLHLPQVYGQLTAGRQEIWLLEDAPISETAVGDTQGQLLPELTQVWKNAPALRQLNWLWQWASIWQPLKSEKVATSLLNPTLLRVEGPIIRLLELSPDPKVAPTLQQLGQRWSQLIAGASPAIAPFFQQLCTQLTDGQIQTSDQLVALLDQALKNCGTGQSRRYHIFTCTDPGPSRHHNEDACYPPSGQLRGPLTNTRALAIVCDGIGGHEGGEIASHLAIDILRERVENLPLDLENWNPTTLTLELEQAVCAANDVISQQNDSEHRSDRQRMGTTLVMAQTTAHEIYITHVGDSRIYWITRHNCHQVTQDDDLASREVRLGYSLYRNALQQPTSGSLIQALGMAPSATLHPTTQRFVLDEDSVFLLCSDGLSDYDRVEQYWQTEILPILEGQIDLPTAGTRLMEIANRQNGHDNVTIALVHCQVIPSPETGQTQLSLPQPEALPSSVASRSTVTANAAPSQMKTQQLPSTSPTDNPAKAPRRRPWGLLLGIVFLLGLGGGLAYLLIPRSWINPLIGLIPTQDEPQNTSRDESEATPPTSVPPSPAQSPLTGASPQDPVLIQLTRSTTRTTQDRNIPLLLRLEAPSQAQSAVRRLPVGSVLQIIGKFPAQQQETWLEVKVCSPGPNKAQVETPESQATSRPPTPVGESGDVSNSQNTSVIEYPPVVEGERGWIRESDITPNINPNFTPTATQVDDCAGLNSADVSTP